jgi:hypothetical protein
MGRSGASAAWSWCSSKNRQGHVEPVEGELVHPLEVGQIAIVHAVLDGAGRNQVRVLYHYWWRGLDDDRWRLLDDDGWRLLDDDGWRWLGGGRCRGRGCGGGCLSRRWRRDVRRCRGSGQVGLRDRVVVTVLEQDDCYDNGGGGDANVRCGVAS